MSGGGGWRRPAAAAVFLNHPQQEEAEPSLGFCCCRCSRQKVRMAFFLFFFFSLSSFSFPLLFFFLYLYLVFLFTSSSTSKRNPLPALLALFFSSSLLLPLRLILLPTCILLWFFLPASSLCKLTFLQKTEELGAQYLPIGYACSSTIYR